MSPLFVESVQEVVFLIIALNTASGTINAQRISFSSGETWQHYVFKMRFQLIRTREHGRIAMRSLSPFLRQIVNRHKASSH